MEMALGAIFGLFEKALSYFTNKQLAQEDRKENYQYGELSADNADKRTRALYQDLYSPGAQLQQVKEAGLSPSVFYQGAGGISGQAGAQGTGAAGIQTHTTDFTGMFPSGVDMAQANMLNSQAELNKAKTAYYEGKNPMGEATIEETIANAGYQKAATKVQNAKEAQIDLDTYIRTQGMEAELFEITQKARKAGYEAEIAYETAQQAGIQTHITRETAEAYIAQAYADVEFTLQGILESKARTALANEQKELIKAEALKTYNDIVIGYASLSIEQQRAQSYGDFVEKEIEMMPKKLNLEKQKMYVDAITEVVKGAAYAAGTILMFKGGNPTTTGPRPSGTGGKWNTPNGKGYGHALDGKGVGTYKKGHNTVWDE